MLKGLLVNFPFVTEVDVVVALAAILTAVLRGAFDVTPMFLFRAHDVGSGKSFLCDLISTIARGRPCPVITNANSTEEMEKRLGALVLSGVQMISLDNCSVNIGGDLLCQITERQSFRIRILGKSEAPECEWRGMLLGTGNNITFVGDMARRGLVANLDPKVERAELREFASIPLSACSLIAEPMSPPPSPSPAPTSPPADPRSAAPSAATANGRKVVRSP